MAIARGGGGRVTIAQLDAVMTMTRTDFKQGASEVTAAIDSLGMRMDTLAAKSKTTSAATGGFFKDIMGGSGGGVGDFVRGLGQSVAGVSLLAGGAAAAGIAVAKLGSAITDIGIGGNANIENLTVSFTTLLGSVDAAQKRMADLTDFAARTPFNLPEVAAASRVLQTMTDGALATAKGLTLVGDVAAGTQQSFQDIAVWIGRAYSAIQSGRPFGEAAQRLQELGALSGDARNQLEAMQKTGASSSQIWAVFSGQMEKFNGLMEKQSHTLTGLSSTIQDNVGAALRTVSAPLFDILKSGAEWLVRQDVQEALTRFAKGLAGVVTVIVDVGRVVLTVLGPALSIVGSVLGLAADGAAAFAAQLDKIAPTAQSAADSTSTAMKSATSSFEQAGVDAGASYRKGVATGLTQSTTQVVTGVDGITRVLEVTTKATDAGTAAGKAYTQDGITTSVNAGKDAVVAATHSVAAGMDQSAVAQDAGKKTGEGWLHGFLSTQIVSQDDLKKFLSTDVGDALKQAAQNWWNAQTGAFGEAGKALAPGTPAGLQRPPRDPDAGAGTRDQGVPSATTSYVDRRDALTRDADRRAAERETDANAKDAVAEGNRAVAAAAAKEAKEAADKAERAYRSSPAGQVDTAIDQARTEDAISRLKANNKEYIDVLVQGQVDANKARDALETAQKAAGLIQFTTAERDAKAAKDKADAEFRATPVGQVDSAIQAAKTEVEVNKLKSVNKQYIDAVVQGQLEANKARDALEIAQKQAGLIEYTTLEQQAKKKQSDAVSALQSTLDFFVKAADFKTDIRGNVNLILDELDYTLKAVVARSATWKAAATDEIGKVAANIKVIGEALSAALNPLSLVEAAGDVGTYMIDAAFSNVDYILAKLDKLASDPRFQGAKLQRLVDLSAAMTYAFAGIKGAVDTVSSIGETQQKVDSGEISYGFDQIYGAFAASGGGSGGGTGGGGGMTYNNCWIVNGELVVEDSPDIAALIKKMAGHVTLVQGGVAVGAGA
jgi:hypothetical protein